MHKRYGKIKLKNHLSDCFLDLFYFMLGIVGLTMGISRTISVIFVGIAVFDVIHTLLTYKEEFEFNKSTLIVYKKGKSKNLNLPLKMTVIISYADMCTDLAKRVTYHNNTYMLKDEWAVSLLEDVSVEKVIEKLHGKGAGLYTNCGVEEHLKHHFVYSFVCNQSMLEEVLSDKNYTLIIPETLLHMIDTKKLKGDIYIDKGF